MKICAKCKGLGAVVVDAKRPGHRERCKDCGGTGREKTTAPAAPIAKGAK